MAKVILSLCDLTGTWSEPYYQAGYEVRRFDISRDPAEDIRLLPPQGKVHGIIAQPPCTEFAGSGARWWASKEAADPDYLTRALALVDACMRHIVLSEPEWWVLENPVGRLKNWLGPKEVTFHPWEYAMLADVPDDESYSKRTCLWGNFVMPEPMPHPQKDAVNKNLLTNAPDSKGRAQKRSATPQGFARAFFRANP